LGAVGGETRDDAPGGAFGLVALELVADAEGGGGAEVGLERGEEGGGVVGVAVEETLLGLADVDEAGADAAVLGERHVDVGDAAVEIPAADGAGEGGGEVPARAFALQVNGGGGHAGSADEAVGPADDGDVLVEGG